MLVAPCALAPSCLIITLLSKQESLLPATSPASGNVEGMFETVYKLAMLAFQGDWSSLSTMSAKNLYNSARL